MRGLWQYIDTAPILDLLFLAIWVSAIAFLLGYAAYTIHIERDYAKKRKRLIELAGGRTGEPARGGPSPSSHSEQDSFDADHGYRKRLGQ